MGGGEILAVVGTDTGVGKTFVMQVLLAAARSAGLAARPLKPFLSGADGDEDDGIRLARAAGLPLEAVSPLRIAAPISPYAAIRRGLAPPIDRARLDEAIRKAKDSDAGLLLVEGIGGIHCPIEAGRTWLDFHAEWGFPSLLVGRSSLGTLSATLGSVEAIARRGFPLRGIVLSHGPGERDDDITRRDNAEILSEWTNLPVVSLPFSSQGPAAAVESLAPFLPRRMTAAVPA